MLFAEEYAKKEGSKTIRLDTYLSNKISNNFYKKLGYLEIGSFFMPRYMPGKYIAYEKII
jgi:ribosomal protein S18 acetylase RimI-like enzyme